jgi:ribosomal protein S18 acetylase RimI-like enzyme
MRHEIDPVHCAAPKISFRRGIVADISALAAIEAQSFPTDRMSLRNFRYAITRAKAIFLVAVQHGRPAGYGLVALHSRTRIGRLSSFAIDPGCRRAGVGRTLLAALEAEAAALGCRSIRLEVRCDNEAALALYTHSGYVRFGVYPNYYEDDATALRLQKTLVHPPAISSTGPAGRSADKGVRKG